MQMVRCMYFRLLENLGGDLVLRGWVDSQSLRESVYLLWYIFMELVKVNSFPFHRSSNGVDPRSQNVLFEALENHNM